MSSRTGKPAPAAAGKWYARRDVIKLTAGCLFSVLACWGVWYNDELQRRRRHSSIAKDIERENWRAAQIAASEGRPFQRVDDGFAERFVADPKNAKDVDEARRVVGDMVQGKPYQAQRQSWLPW